MQTDMLETTLTYDHELMRVLQNQMSKKSNFRLLFP